MGDIEGGKSLYQKAIEIFGKHKQERSKALAEHFYSHLIRNVDVEIYNALRKSIELAAKKHSLKELLKPLPDNF